MTVMMLPIDRAGLRAKQLRLRLRTGQQSAQHRLKAGFLFVLAGEHVFTSSGPASQNFRRVGCAVCKMLGLISEAV